MLSCWKASSSSFCTLSCSRISESMVTEEVRNMVEEAEQKIASGEIVVGTAYGMETDAITQLRDSVKP